MNVTFSDDSPQAIQDAMSAAKKAAIPFRNLPIAKRAAFMRAIADGLDNSGDELLQIAMAETHLPEARLRGERGRTSFQLRNYADACEQGNWLQASIDLANADKTPPKPDIRKVMRGLGPVVVFGSSNFPFAYSTAGGDTASAFAAGCPVVVKAHPAHPQTSERVAQIIMKAATDSQMPAGVFAHLHGSSFEVGKALVLHPYTAAVGFTGSFAGGKALFDLANQRQEPIPVFAEMGSVNPVWLLPEKLQLSAAIIASQYAASINVGVGQFCTNPGILLGIRSKELSKFVEALAAEIKNLSAGTMLHGGIAKSYEEKRSAALAQQGITLVAEGQPAANEMEAISTIATVSGKHFLQNPLLHQEVFGPYSLVVQCEDKKELIEIATVFEGQLTATLMATETDMHEYKLLTDLLAEKCGRLVYNGVPTGVEVCDSMQHGGPYPATTDSRFTSVGADAIRRFVRPVSFQNWPDHLLPPSLQNSNPLKISRNLNGKISKDAIV